MVKETFVIFEKHLHITASVRHCSICRTETTGASLCDRCARHLRRDCQLVHLAIAAGACVGSGTIANLRRDEEKLKEYDKWKEANSAQPE